jgi:hypothetical protein
MGGRMNRSNKARWVLGVLLLTLLSLGTACREGLSDTRGPEIGTRLPSVLAEARMRNAPVGEPPAEGGWIVYVFSPLSPKSEANQKHVEELARSLPSDWVLLAVATEAEGARAFCERLHVTVPVLTQMPAATLKAYKISAAPGSTLRTYLLDKDWRLLEVLEGPYRGKVAEKLAARFKTRPSSEAPPMERPAGGPSSPNLCRDRQQSPYSRGSKADALGVKLRCGPEGVWGPAA